MTFTDTKTYQHRRAVDAALAYQFDAVTTRIVAEREANYRNSGERQIVARWLPFSEVPTAEVTIYRGEQVNTYNIRKRSASAFRLAFLVGENGRPLFGEGVTMHKAMNLADVTVGVGA